MRARTQAQALALAQAQQETEQGGTHSPAPDTAPGSNDIIVTAAGRYQSLQQVPIAVTVLDGALFTLAGIVDIRDLPQFAPSLQAIVGQSAATGTAVYLRGMGTGGDNPGFEPAVGVVIDGVFRARSGAALNDLPELSRVEILRGPQGTLFGRNTSAGVVSIETAGPGTRFGGYVDAEAGNHGAWAIQGAVSGPVTPWMALRLDAGIRRRDGEIGDANSTDRINDRDRSFVRGQAVIDIGTARLRLIADHGRIDESCCGAVAVTRGDAASVLDALAGASGLTGVWPGPAEGRTTAVTPGRGYGEHVRDWGVSAQLDMELGAARLTSITAYRDWRATRDQDVDFSGADRIYRDDYRTTLRDFTQELRLSGAAFGGALDWLVGGFFLDEKLHQTDTVRLGTQANAYVDMLLGGALSAPPSAGGMGMPAQFYGSFPIPTLNDVAANLLYGVPLPAGSVPLMGQILYLSSPALQAAAPPGSALFDYLNAPLAGVVAGQGNKDDRFRVATQSLAFFTHNIVHLNDRLALTLGARLTQERKRLHASIRDDTGSCAFFLNDDPRAQAYRAAIAAADPALFANFFLLSCNPAVNTEFNGDYADSRNAWRLSGTAKLSFTVSPRLMLYFGYDRGHRSGGYNLDQASFDTRVLGGNGAQASDLAFGSESVDSYEIGLKLNIAPQAAFNLALFRAEYHDLQSLTFETAQFVVQNVPQARSQGVEAEAVLHPAPPVEVRIGYSYTDARYGDSTPLTGALAGMEGEPFRDQPRHVVTAAASWTPAIVPGIHGRFQIDSRYQSATELAGHDAITGRGIVRNPAFALVNARIGVEFEDSGISAELFVRNLTDQFYMLTGFSVPEQPDSYAGFPGAPRRWGMRVRVRF